MPFEFLYGQQWVLNANLGQGETCISIKCRSLTTVYVSTVNSGCFRIETERFGIKLKQLWGYERNIPCQNCLDYSCWRNCNLQKPLRLKLSIQWIGEVLNSPGFVTHKDKMIWIFTLKFFRFWHLSIVSYQRISFVDFKSPLEFSNGNKCGHLYLLSFYIGSLLHCYLFLLNNLTEFCAIWMDITWETKLRVKYREVGVI